MVSEQTLGVLLEKISALSNRLSAFNSKWTCALAWGLGVGWEGNFKKMEKVGFLYPSQLVAVGMQRKGGLWGSFEKESKTG